LFKKGKKKKKKTKLSPKSKPNIQNMPKSPIFENLAIGSTNWMPTDNWAIIT
jgi:hypothetical protein